MQIHKLNQYDTIKMPAVQQQKLIEQSRIPVCERPTVKITAVVVSR
jgi:hypothetical protein